VHAAAMQPYLSFLAVAAVTVLIPGPDTFVVLRTALTDGPRAGTFAAAGSGTGNLLWGTASILGVAGLLAASSSAFAVIKLAGAAYLLVLGVQALRAAARGERLAADDGPRIALSPATSFRRGFASDVLNVKVGLFWTALVPQFVSADASAMLPVMVVTMAALVFAWLAAYARLAARMSRALRRRGSSRAINGTVGAVLVGLGARVSVAHP
jgi:threonine/homoserine/homoserine lactone efflux protein